MTLRTLAIAASMTLATVPCARAQEATVFRTRTDVVRVDVLATENGKPITGLGPDDFEVFDNGIRQQVDLVSFEQLPLNIVLAFDVSDSVSGERLAHLATASRAILDRLERSDQVALVSFSHVVRLGAGLSSDAAAVARALDASGSGGDTSLVDATYTAMLVGESDVGRALVIVFSDGLDTSSWLRADAVLDIAKRTDAVVYGVAVRSVGMSPFIRDMADQTGGRQFEVESTKDLGEAFAGILEEFRRRYVIGYSPRDVAAGGWHALTVRIKGQRGAARSRPGYLASGS